MVVLLLAALLGGAWFVYGQLFNDDQDPEVVTKTPDAGPRVAQGPEGTVLYVQVGHAW